MEEKQEEKERETFKSRRDAKNSQTVVDLQDAVDTINNFATMYRKAAMAIKNLERAGGQASAAGRGAGVGGMFGGGSGDPFSSMMMGVVQEAVERKTTEIAAKKVEGMDLSSEGSDVSEEEMVEARGGLESEAEKGEESEE